jgi:xanthine dehydrogenase accessory factor
MKELRDILDALAEAQARGERAALGTVIRVRGSTYRREGARLLIRADGQTVGSVSGGCLEGDIAEIARDVLAAGRPRLAQYDLTSDDDAVWGLGLGCNGAIDVLIEPVPGDLPVRLRRAIDERRTLVLATLVGGPDPLAPGARIYLPEDGAPEGSLGDAALDQAAVAAARRQLEARRSAVVSLESARGPAEVFVEVLAPPLPLLVCGAGHDVIPLVRLAHELGWWVMVADSRPAYARRERFPGADEVVLAADEEVPQKVRIDRHTFVVVMTHNFLHDRRLLRGLLATPARYIGLLGPRARTDRLLAELARDGVNVSDGQRARLFGPVGVDLGAESPEEIALSILAEILALHNGRPKVASLRERGGPIHVRA